MDLVNQGDLCIPHNHYRWLQEESRYRGKISTYGLDQEDCVWKSIKQNATISSTTLCLDLYMSMDVSIGSYTKIKIVIAYIITYHSSSINDGHIVIDVNNWFHCDVMSFHWCIYWCQSIVASLMIILSYVWMQCTKWMNFKVVPLLLVPLQWNPAWIPVLYGWN